MSDTKKLLLEQILYQANKATGDTSGIMPELEKISTILDVDIENITENNRRLQLKELENEKAAAAAVIASLAAEYPAADQSKRQLLIEDIQRGYETLKKTVTGGPKIITSKELMATQYPPRKWIVENLIGPGLTILSGAPKIGKSWLLFALAEAASVGGNFLDKYKVNKTKVLHLSLEDTPRSIKERRAILAHKQEGGFSGNNDLFIATEWETGLAGLENYLMTHNEIKLVIIDTLGRFMPDIEDMNDYAPTVKALAAIKKLADSLDIAILVVHHAKKGSAENKGDWMDQSLGSTGIVGSADTVILLQRDIETKSASYKNEKGETKYKTISTGNRLNTGKLYATGRSIKDLFHEVEFLPEWGMWAITDKKETLDNPGQNKTPTQDNDDNFEITAAMVGAKKRG